MRAVLRRCAALVVALVWILTPSPGHAAAKEKKPKPETRHVWVERWLVLGPVTHPLPAFAEAEHGGFKPEDLLTAGTLPEEGPNPRPDLDVVWFSGPTLRWTAREVGRSHEIPLSPPDTGSPAQAWLAVYVSADRFLSLDLEVFGGHPRRAWLDGELVAPEGADEARHGDKQREGQDSAGDAEAKVKGGLRITPGKHRLIVQTVFDPARRTGWSVGASLTAGAGDPSPKVAFSTDPLRDVELRDITDAPRIAQIALAPQGMYVVVANERVIPGTSKTETWMDLLSTLNGGRGDSWRGGTGVRQLAWSPNSQYLGYIVDDPPSSQEDRSRADDDDADENKTASLFLRDRTDRKILPLLQRVKGLEGYRWSADGSTLAYWTKEKAKPDERGVKKLNGLMDRWANFRDKQYLYLVTVPGGVRRQLTAGDLSAEALDFSRDSRLLFRRQVEDLSERPYSRTELWEMNLGTFVSRKLRDFRWLNSATYSPDGTRLLIHAGPAEFGAAGLAIPEGQVPNAYDGQLFIWDPSSDAVDPITREFGPAVKSASWSPHDQKIYLTAEDHDYVRLYRYDVEARSFKAIGTTFDVLTDLEVAKQAPYAVGLGSSAWDPEGIVVLDLNTTEPRWLTHPADNWFADVRWGTVEPWTFTTASGATIDGRVYLPPDFDPKQTYPGIVFYYGGTHPVSREFGGRYPKEWWAARGYVVYVLQPSGATGYGQAFSALHVNDWGKTTAAEIIEGTRKFLEAHPYVDPKRVGCIGASYGGFMTMLLASETDLFAAAVAHAGISSLASYWGEGYWGYSYSAVATADSFPWNRKDLYVEQSPLFHADQVRVPILLTHGADDTNVPVGESDAFYVALKLLGKPVEYVQVEGQDHWILEPAKRKLWSSTILAWFDRWLKGQPQWWDDLYK